MQSLYVHALFIRLLVHGVMCVCANFDTVTYIMAVLIKRELPLNVT